MSDKFNFYAISGKTGEQYVVEELSLNQAVGAVRGALLAGDEVTGIINVEDE